MTDKRKIVIKLLTYLIVITAITFNTNQLVFGYEKITKNDMDLEKLNNGDIPFTSNDYEEIRQLILNYKDTKTSEITEYILYKDNSKVELANKFVVPDDDISIYSDNYITYYEYEPNDTLYNANILNTRFDDSLNHIIIGTITNYYFDIDYYRINLNKNGLLDIMGLWGGNVAGNGWEDDLGIGLKNSNGDLLLVASLKGYGSDTYRHLSANLSSGTYYIMVIQMSDYKYLYTDEQIGRASCRERV